FSVSWLYEEFIYCCGAATQVLKCGPWKDLLETESKTLPRHLFLIIPVTCWDKEIEIRCMVFVLFVYMCYLSSGC
uniref:Uncharacterized protein n=1 Tax=Chrysemys picta bellii TaxID=8478 RepID=A0A8C3FSK0_CHRPI